MRTFTFVRSFDCFVEPIRDFNLCEDAVCSVWDIPDTATRLHIQVRATPAKGYTKAELALADPKRELLNRVVIDGVRYGIGYDEWDTLREIGPAVYVKAWYE